MNDHASIVTIGGGTGQFMLLSGLKKYPVRLTAVVSMADDGGSTGVLRDELGVLPPGDVRQCLVALSESDQMLRDLFNYRFDAGGLKGHSFGNLFLSALEKTTGSFEQAVSRASKILAIGGEVVPVVTKPVTLVCGHGSDVCRGEHAVDLALLSESSSLRLEPEVLANPRAIEVVAAADLIVIGPGNFFCSLIPNLLVPGMADAIADSQAKVVLNCNLMNKLGHTDGFTVQDYVSEVERHIGTGRIDFVTYNDTIPEAELLSRYGEEGKSLLVPPTPTQLARVSWRPLSAPLIAGSAYRPQVGDPIRRTLIRHDSDVLARLIIDECLSESDGGHQRSAKDRH